MQHQNTAIGIDQKKSVIIC